MMGDGGGGHITMGVLNELDKMNKETEDIPKLAFQILISPDGDLNKNKNKHVVQTAWD